jgi:ankyrin repeat protein
MQLLLDGNAKVDVADKRGENRLIILNQHQLIYTISSFKPHINTYIGFTPLLMAATEDYFDAVRMLVKYGANPAYVGPEGRYLSIFMLVCLLAN